MLPLTVSMVHYGNREFYGTIDKTIAVQGRGQLSFENGDLLIVPQITHLLFSIINQIILI